jgi:anaerobic magnesium-protoporphyrin IX monomethyl ester cyclase
MKIALVRFYQRKGSTGTIPWHYSFYKTILEKEGHCVDIFDNQVLQLSVGDLVDAVLDTDAEVIGVGGIGTVYNPLKKFCNKIKKINTSILIVVGGHITADYDFLLRKVSIDVVVRGEGEVTLQNIVSSVADGKDWFDVKGIAYLKNGVLRETQQEKLIAMDVLPDFCVEHFEMAKYKSSVDDTFIIDDKAKMLKENGDLQLSIFLARGCPFNCFFCYRHIPGYRYYSRERLEYILKYFKGKGYSFFSFGDECVTANKKNLKNICELALENNIYWGTSGRVDQLSHEVLRLLAEHNCAFLQFGVESFDQSMLDQMNKKTTVKQNVDAMNLSYQYGISSVLLLIIGTPGEDRATILNTRSGMWECFLPHDRIQCAILNPYPGSPAYYYGIENGYIGDREKIHSEFSDKNEIIINFSKLSILELKAWQRWLPCEAAISYRLKKRKLLFNRNFCSRFKQFLLCYSRLLREPGNLCMFTLYLLKGIRYWVKPLPHVEWAEKAPERLKWEQRQRS